MLPGPIYMDLGSEESLDTGWSWRTLQSALGASSHLSSEVPLWKAKTFFLEIGKVYAEILTAVFTWCPYAHLQQNWHHTE